MFINKKNLKYRSYQTDIAIPIETLDEGTNFTKDFKNRKCLILTFRNKEVIRGNTFWEKWKPIDL